MLLRVTAKIKAFITNVTDVTASSPHVFKIQSQTSPIFALALKLLRIKHLFCEIKVVEFVLDLDAIKPEIVSLSKKLFLVVSLISVQ